MWKLGEIENILGLSYDDLTDKTVNELSDTLNAHLDTKRDAKPPESDSEPKHFEYWMSIWRTSTSMTRATRLSIWRGSAAIPKSLPSSGASDLHKAANRADWYRSCSLVGTSNETVYQTKPYGKYPTTSL